MILSGCLLCNVEAERAAQRRQRAQEDVVRAQARVDEANADHDKAMEAATEVEQLPLIPPQSL